MLGVVSWGKKRQAFFLFYLNYSVTPNFPFDIYAMIYVFFRLEMAKAPFVTVLTAEAA